MFSLLKWAYVGIAITILLAIIGFAIGTFKVPESTTFEVTRRAGGAKIDEVIVRFIKFKRKKKRIYLYSKEGKK